MCFLVVVIVFFFFRGALTANLKHMWRIGVLLWDQMHLNGRKRKNALWNTDGSLKWSSHGYIFPHALLKESYLINKFMISTVQSED